MLITLRFFLGAAAGLLKLGDTRTLSLHLQPGGGYAAVFSPK